jgi:hypothetical protein
LKTCQAIAQFWKCNKEAMLSLSKPFFSKQQDQEIDCENFVKIQQGKIPLLTLLKQL